MGKDLGGLLMLLAMGAVVLGVAGFFAKPKCPACKNVLQDKPARCPYCRTPLVWKG